MLRDLTIQNYRAFKDFSIDGLARVNLIVGDNNSGKTSFLEAVYLLQSQDNQSALLKLLSVRGEFSEHTGPNGLPETDFYIAHLFRGHNPRVVDESLGDPKIVIYTQQDTPSALSISLSLPRRDESALEKYFGLRSASFREAMWGAFQLTLQYSKGESEPRESTYHVADDFTIRPAFLRPDDLLNPEQFVTSSEANYAHLAQMWDKITLTPEETSVIDALRILEPTVEGIGFTSRQTTNSGALIKLSGQDGPIPLGSMGTGMRRILALAIPAVRARNAVLLVDEIDTGLYHGAQADMWRLLIEIAKRLNVQIFATTHSWDCVEAFQEALSAQDDRSIGRLFRLEERQGDIKAVLYDAEDLDVVVRQGIEVR